VPEAAKRDGNQILDDTYQHLVNVIEGPAESRLTPGEALKSLELTLAAVESAHAGGKPITVS
jgi:hypothetical protein